MIQYIDRYLELEDVKKNNPFLSKSPNMASLPIYEQSKGKLPEPIWEGHEISINAYYKAWQIAFSNLRQPTNKNKFISPYIDAAFNNHMFMWDSCFMLMFGKYGNNVFNFQSTLDNFYCKQEPDGFIGREYNEVNGLNKFHRLDPVSTGPELLAWCEWLYYKSYGDKERLRDVYYPLLCYHRWLKNYHRWKDGSYWSTGWGCGMDNLPRHDIDTVPLCEDWHIGTFHHSFMSWIDANSQAVLTCSVLLNMAKELSITDEIDELKNEREYLINFINDKMWSQEDKFYYDLRSNGELLNVKSVASFWTLISNIVPKNRLDDYVTHLKNENEFNRPHRVPALSADNPDYNQDGGYWNGGIWSPTEYMIIRGLSQNSYDDLAYDIALNHYNNVIETYRKTGTFWENYAPEHQGEGKPSHKDFVGWTGLAPITIFIEYILGIEVKADTKEIVWRIHNTERHGIKNLPVGKDITVNLICEKRDSIKDKPVIYIKCSDKIKVKVVYDDNKSLIY